MLSLLDSKPIAYAANNVTYFAPTGQYIGNAFKYHWEAYGGLEQFGFPISATFNEVSPTDGKTYPTQYFERAIFEYHPENAGNQYQVLLRLIGNIETKGRTFVPAQLKSTNDTRLYFKETDHTLEGVFRTYWESRGGLPTFGYPISENVVEVNPADNKTYVVQYFERVRMEYHPELIGTRYEILLGLLGWQQLSKMNVPQEYRTPQLPGLENVVIVAGSSQPPTFPAAPIGSRPLPTPTPVPGEGGGGGVVIGTPVPTPSPVATPTPAPGNTPTPIQPSGGPLKGPHIGYGMNVWLFQQDKDRVLNLVKEAGFDWIRQQVGWNEIEAKPGQYDWSELDRIVDATSRNNIKVILSVVRSPSWAGIGGTNGLPANPANFNALMTRMATRYKGRVAAYEVWNEQNISRETGGRVDVAPYIETLKAGYNAVKSVDQNAVVIYGGLSPTGINDVNYAIDDARFLEMSYQYNGGEMKKYFDVLGVHPGGHGNTPDEFWPNDAPTDVNRGWTTHPSFYFRRVENLRAIMEQYGDADKQVWMTEFGWTTANSAPGYEYGALNTEDEQAQYLVRAFQKAKNDYPWMGVMAMWQLNFATLVSTSDEKSPWGLLRNDFSKRPSFEALKNMAK